MDQTGTLHDLLPRRPLWAGLLHSLAALPPEAVLAVLQLLRGKVLDAGEGVPARLRGAPFGDAALAQVATARLVSRHDFTFAAVVALPHRRRTGNVSMVHGG
jgi:hypothetical protein